MVRTATRSLCDILLTRDPPVTNAARGLSSSAKTNQDHLEHGLAAVAEVTAFEIPLILDRLAMLV